MRLTSRRVEVQAVAIDLLTALIDSWTLWESVAGEIELGRSWRRTSLQLITAAGTYVPYDEMVREAAAHVGVPLASAEDLLARWGELRPWPEVPDVLARLRRRRLAAGQCPAGLGRLPQCRGPAGRRRG